jgi:uncharacterized phage-associated protein
MATVFDVAKYIVDELGEIDTWKLQKLVYYCQAWSLVWDEKPLFNEPIEAWANGPVCRALYNRHKKMYSVGPLTPIWDGANPAVLTDSEKETINVIIKDYGTMPGYELRALTHMEEPWNEARKGVPLMAPCENEITHEMMRLYYGAL